MTRPLLLTAALLAAVPAFASTWKNDEAHSKAAFEVKHMMVSTVRGELGPIQSTLQVDDKDFTRSKLEATVDVTKINTGVARRDAHLRSADFFATDKFPTLRFKSKAISKAGDRRYKIVGDLTLRDVTKEVTLDAVATDEVQNPWSKATTRGFSATTTLNREDFGLTWNQPMANNGVVVSREVKIFLDVEYTRADEPAEKAAAGSR